MGRPSKVTSDQGILLMVRVPWLGVAAGVGAGVVGAGSRAVAGSTFRVFWGALTRGVVGLTGVGRAISRGSFRGSGVGVGRGSGVGVGGVGRALSSTSGGGCAASTGAVGSPGTSASIATGSSGGVLLAASASGSVEGVGGVEGVGVGAVSTPPPVVSAAAMTGAKWMSMLLSPPPLT